MRLYNRNGLTLVESLIAIFLLSTLLVSILGAFFISKLSASHAKHRLTAMNLLREFVEQEIKAGYDGGNDNEADYYLTVISADPVTRVVDGKTFSIRPDPYYPDNVDGLVYGTVPYKIVGFIVTWAEDVTGQVCSERAVTYVTYHSSS